MTLLEPDVALTDFAIAIECAAFVALLSRVASVAGMLRGLFIAFFAAVGLAAMLGGSAHGFFADKGAFVFRVLWTATLAAIGVAAFASWAIGARLWLAEATARQVTLLAALLLAANIVVIMFASQIFVLAIIHYLPAAIFLLVSFAIAYRRRPQTFLMSGIVGMLLTFVAAAIQQGGIDLHPVYFNHNALYHLVQGIALALIFLAARGVLRAPRSA